MIGGDFKQWGNVKQMQCFPAEDFNVLKVKKMSRGFWVSPNKARAQTPNGLHPHEACTHQTVSVSHASCSPISPASPVFRLVSHPKMKKVRRREREDPKNTWNMQFMAACKVGNKEELEVLLEKGPPRSHALCSSSAQAEENP